MKRVLSLYLPTWPTDRLCRKLGRDAPPPEQPLVLVGMDKRKRSVLSLNLAAMRVGVRKGMAVTKAQALFDGLKLMDADPEADIEALEKLAVWTLQHISPQCSADRPDGLVIETTGADHLFGGEAAMLDMLLARLDESGIMARAAIANSWGAAHAFARFVASPTFIAPSDGAHEVLGNLPLSALRLPSELVESLNALNFIKIDEIERLPRASLTLRFGPEVGRRLDHAFGREHEPINAVEAPGLVEVTRAFAEPIGAAETIARYVAKLTDQLCDKLELAASGARRVDLICHRVDNRIEYVSIATAKPVRDVKRLTKLLCDKIETIDPGFGIERMALSAPLIQALSPRQMRNSLIEEPEADTSDLFDTLANRFGAARFHRMAPIATDIPERSISLVPADTAIKNPPWQTRWPRPVQLLARPEPIQVVALLPDHPPVSITWRGTRHRIRAADGPERVRGEWWDRAAEYGRIRDYFRVEDEAGESFWIFRDGDGERASTGAQTWFMQGIFA